MVTPAAIARTLLRTGRQHDSLSLAVSPLLTAASLGRSSQLNKLFQFKASSLAFPATSSYSTAAATATASSSNDTQAQLQTEVEATIIPIVSIAPKGTILKGINVMKAGNDPVAMEEKDYPSWLWNLTTDKKDALSSSSLLTRDMEDAEMEEGLSEEEILENREERMRLQNLLSIKHLRKQSKQKILTFSLNKATKL